MFKYQQFDDSNSKEKRPRVYKCLQIDQSDNKKQDLDKDEGKVDRYVCFPPAPPLFPPQKESNYLSDLNRGIKSLIYFVCLPKTASQRVANFASEFPNKKDLK